MQIFYPSWAYLLLKLFNVKMIIIIIFLTTTLIFLLLLFLKNNKEREENLEIDYNLVKKMYQESDFPKNFYIEQDRAIQGIYKASLEVITHFNKITKFKFFKEPEPLTTTTVLNKSSTVIKFHDESESCGYPFDGRGNVLAHADLPPGLKICFDISESWTPKMLTYTLYHELMHHLGLRHSITKDSIMYPRYSEEINGPTKFDLMNLKILYPFITLE